MTPAAFPELGFLPSQVREFVLWHRRGQMGLEGSMQGPLERLVVQGQEGTSLFILVEGPSRSCCGERTVRTGRWTRG